MSHQEEAQAVTLMPVQIITNRISQGDDVGVALWRFCANQWLSDTEVSPLDYFYPPESEDDDAEEVEDDVEDFDPEDIDEQSLEEENALDEQVAIEREYLDALLMFWTDMKVFKPPVSTPLFDEVIGVVSFMIPHVPADLSKLCDHIERINKVRIQAQAMQANPLEHRDSWLREKLGIPAENDKKLNRDFFNQWTAQPTGRF